MTRAELIVECRRRAAKERKCAKEFREWVGLRVASGAEAADRWAVECDEEAAFFDALVGALREGG